MKILQIIFWVIILIAVFCFSVVMIWLIFPHIYEAIQNLESGDWTTLICYMHAVPEPSSPLPWNMTLDMTSSHSSMLEY